MPPQTATKGTHHEHQLGASAGCRLPKKANKTAASPKKANRSTHHEHQLDANLGAVSAKQSTKARIMSIRWEAPRKRPRKPRIKEANKTAASPKKANRCMHHEHQLDANLEAVSAKQSPKARIMSIRWEAPRKRPRKPRIMSISWVRQLVAASPKRPTRQPPPRRRPKRARIMSISWMQIWEPSQRNNLRRHAS